MASEVCITINVRVCPKRDEQWNDGHRPCEGRQSGPPLCLSESAHNGFHFILAQIVHEQLLVQALRGGERLLEHLSNTVVERRQVISFGHPPWLPPHASHSPTGNPERR
jgi:hypothetical protein